MVDPGLFLAFIVAVAILMLTPGPNVALIFANSVTYGPKYGLLTVAGVSSAMIVQLSFTALGMTKLLGTLGAWFEWLRWIGVAYLVYLGIAQWRASAINLTKTRLEPRSARAIYTKAVLVSLTNPKTLLFYSAFFPQFITMDRHIGTQVAILSVTFLIVAVLVDGGWALVAGCTGGMLTSHSLRNKVSGGLLVGVGAALAFARNK